MLLHVQSIKIILQYKAKQLINEIVVLLQNVADTCTIVIIYYVERTLVNCYNLCPIQLL